MFARLAAGDDAAWARVKQAKDTRELTFMALVGIHYRLLFAARQEGRLLALDLVSREDLLVALKRLR